MKKIYLSLNGRDLGYLMQDNSEYIFVADENAISVADQEEPFAMMMFKLNKKGTKRYSQIPTVFANFLISNTRRDLMLKAKIEESDCPFEKLYKLAGLDLMAINFNIHQ